MADYEGVLTDLKAKRSTLDQERERLNTAIVAIESLVVSAGREEPRPAISPRTFAGLNMPQALVKYAKVAQQPQTTSQVAGALRIGGMRASAKSFQNQVYNILRRLSDSGGPWQRESDGRWIPRVGSVAQAGDVGTAGIFGNGDPLD